MNATDTRYQQFALVRDMLDTPNIIEKFNSNQAVDVASQITGVGKLLMTGEGSSRIFPAKNAIAHARRQGWPLQLHTEAGRQSKEYDLANWAVFANSNSGRTAEVIELYQSLRERGHSQLFSLTAFESSKLGSLAKQAFVLSCGPEGAVAATKRLLRDRTADVQALADMARHSDELFRTAEAVEGMSSFLEKRRPVWQPAQ